MNPAQINTFIDAFNEMDSPQCMIFNNLVSGSISEVQPSGTIYNGSVSMLASSFEALSEADKDILCNACKDKLAAGILNKKVNTRPCEVR